MASKAQSFVDVVLGEAVHGSPVQRYEDMKAIASAVVNRANALGVSIKDVISAKGQFGAFGKSLPPGVEAFRALAEKAIADVVQFGPTHAGMFYATPSATKNLPSGLQPVTQTAGHIFFDDPKNRAIATSQGYITPEKSKGLGLAALAPNGLIDTVTAPVNAAKDFAQGLYSRFSPVESMNVSPMPSNMAAGLQFAHANQSNIAPGLEDALMGVSAELGQPLGITSGFRSSAYNAGVGGAKNSYHTKGLAADIDMTGMTPAQRQDLVTELTQRGVGGLIAYSKSPNMMHVDMRPRDPSASPHFMFDKTAARMPNAPGWFKEMAEYGGIKTPDVGPVPPSRTDPAPTPRSALDAISSLFSMEAAAAPALASYADLDTSRFGPSAPSMRSSPIGMVSSPVSPIGAYARAEAPIGFSPPSPERFGYNVADIDPARFGPVDISPAASVASFSQPSAERFGYAPEAKSGSLGGLGGMSAKAAVDPDRFGPAQMTSTPTTGRLSSTVNASNSTPMAASLSPVGIGPQSLSSPVQRAAEDAGYLTTHVNTTSVAPTAMGLLPSTAQAPVGSFSTFNPMPTDLNVLDKALNRLPTNPPLSLPNMPVIPSVVPPAVKTPTVAPMVTPVPTRVAPVPPTVAVAPRAPTSSASVRPSPAPAATAADVYAGRATTGVASNGATVSRDPVTGNISVTNQFGATTVTDPSGRQMGNLSGVGKAIGDKVTPGMIGAVVGGAVAGLPGAVAGYALGNRASGQTGQKTGGLGGLGGFLSGLFGGGNSSNGGGGSSGGRGGGSSGSRGGPAGADRDHAGNN